MRLVQQRLFPRLLQLLPRTLLAVLDGWAYGLARSRAERRRRLGR